MRVIGLLTGIVMAAARLEQENTNSSDFTPPGLMLLFAYMIAIADTG